MNTKNTLLIGLMLLLSGSSFSQDACEIYQQILNYFDGREAKAVVYEDINKALSDTNFSFDSIRTYVVIVQCNFYIFDTIFRFRKAEFSLWNEPNLDNLNSPDDFLNSTRFPPEKCLFLEVNAPITFLNFRDPFPENEFIDSMQTSIIIFGDILFNEKTAVTNIYFRFWSGDHLRRSTYSFIFKQEKDSSNKKRWEIAAVMNQDS